MKYLGRTITFEEQETIEIKNRIRFACSSFAKHRQELTSRSFLLRHRLRLLDAVITPSMLYGAGAWIPMFEHKKMIRSTGREMLRLVVQTTRKYKARKDSEEKDRTHDEWSNNGLSTRQKMKTVRAEPMMKKKTGSTSLKEAPEWRMKKCGHSGFHAGSNGN